MKSFKQKQEELAMIKDKLAKSKLTVFTSFARVGEKGLNVSDMRQLKKTLRENDADYLVEKKTLLDLALKNETRKLKELGEIDVFKYNGSVGVAFGYGDQVGVAKSLYAFSRKFPALKFFGALFGQFNTDDNIKFLNSESFIRLAKLPSREVLLSQFMGLLKHNLSALANVLDQIIKQKN